MNHRKRIGLMLCSALLVAVSAAGQAAEQPKLMGYLGDYSKLEPVKGEKGEEIRRWVNTKLKRGEYQKILIDPVVFHPAPQASKQVSGETLYQIRDYTDKALRREIGQSFLIVDHVGPGVARVRIALTGVTTEAEGLKPYEYIPFAAVAAGAATVAGTRDRKAFFMVEAEVTDSVTKERLGIAMRKIPGKKVLENDKQMLTLDLLRPVIDAKANNARLILDRNLK